MFLTMFKKNQNIVLTMHISDVFGKNILNKLKFAINPMKFATNCDKSAFFNNLLTNTRRKLTCLALTSFNLLV